MLGIDPLSLATGTSTAGWTVTTFVYLLLWAGLIDFVVVFPRPLGPLVRRPWLRLVPYVVVYGTYVAALGLVVMTQPNPLLQVGASLWLTTLSALLAFVAIPVLSFVR